MDNGLMFIFPHEDDTFTNSKETIRTVDIVLAEVSYPSTGQGIELGWANDSNIPIVCMHKAGAKVSNSLRAVSSTFLEYSSPREMTEILTNFLKTHQ